jgi:hypothetical protein
MGILACTVVKMVIVALCSSKVVPVAVLATNATLASHCLLFGSSADEGDECGENVSWVMKM